MNKSERIYKMLRKNRIIALLTPAKPKDCLNAYDILNPMGIVLEVAFRSEAAKKGIEAVLRKYPDAPIMAGTVMTEKQAKHAIKAGVSGIVSADFVPSVVKTAVKYDIMCVPGGIGDAGKQLSFKAELYGCEMEELRDKYPYQWVYKLFPAQSGNRTFYQLALAWKGPYKDLTIIYTGGVSSRNLGEIAKFDADGIFCGSALTKKLEEPEKMKKEAERWISIISKVSK